MAEITPTGSIDFDFSTNAGGGLLPGVRRKRPKAPSHTFLRCLAIKPANHRVQNKIFSGALGEQIDAVISSQEPPSATGSMAAAFAFAAQGKSIPTRRRQKRARAL